jgi:predicted AAA+ superfamily ATPase
MMQAFFKTHRYLLDHLDVPVKRGLMNKVNWDHRLIGILGARGVGKTNFLLDYVSTNFGTDKSCLYVNLNNLYFSNRTIASFADEFQKTGGKTLVLDQLYKYPNWKEELIFCHDNFPSLKIIFSGSPLMQTEEGDTELDGRARIYHLNGFSFREFLNYKTDENFQAYSLEDILTRHGEIASEIVQKVKPLAYFTDYLHHGYYPFFLEKRNYLENLLKNINLALEIDISYLQQIELKYLPKLRKLLYLIAISAPFQPNISKLSSEIETSRATVMNYLKYLSQANIINLLYGNDPDQIKKPALVYLQNPNLFYSVARGEMEGDSLYKTFFYSQVGYQQKLAHCNNGDFLIPEHGVFKIGGDVRSRDLNGAKVWQAIEMAEIGKNNQIPLWLFGFLF